MTTQDNNEKIALKVKKLLAKANGGTTQHEAEALIAKAQEMCIQHNLSIQYVESVKERATEEDEFVEHRSDFVRVPYESKLVAPLIRDFFYVNPVLSGSKAKPGFIFIGRQSNLEVGIYAFEYLSRVFLELWLTYRKEQKRRGINVSGGMKIEFMNGLQGGFIAKMKAQRAKFGQAENALVVVESELAGAVKAKLGNTKALKQATFSGFEHAWQQGWREGNKLEIAAGVAAGKKQEELK